jgi:hypothetical protein
MPYDYPLLRGLHSQRYLGDISCKYRQLVFLMGFHRDIALDIIGLGTPDCESDRKSVFCDRRPMPNELQFIDRAVNRKQEVENNRPYKAPLYFGNAIDTSDIHHEPHYADGTADAIERREFEHYESVILTKDS